MKTALYLQASAIRISKKMEISKNVCGLAQQVTGPTVRKRTPFLASKLLRNSKVTNCRKKRLSWHPRKKKQLGQKERSFHKPFRVVRYKARLLENGIGF